MIVGAVVLSIQYILRLRLVIFSVGTDFVTFGHGAAGLLLERHAGRCSWVLVQVLGILQRQYVRILLLDFRTVVWHAVIIVLGGRVQYHSLIRLLRIELLACLMIVWVYDEAWFNCMICKRLVGLLELVYHLFLHQKLNATLFLHTLFHICRWILETCYGTMQVSSLSISLMNY